MDVEKSFDEMKGLMRSQTFYSNNPKNFKTNFKKALKFLSFSKKFKFN